MRSLDLLLLLALGYVSWKLWRNQDALPWGTRPGTDALAGSSAPDDPDPPPATVQTVPGSAVGSDRLYGATEEQAQVYTTTTVGDDRLYQ